MDVGTGITIAFGTSSFTAEVLSINGNDISRTAVDVTHMGSSRMEFMPGDLVDEGSIDLEIGLDPDVQPPISGVAETITITFPIPAGDSNGATLVFTGFVTDWSFAVPLEDKMTATVTIKSDGLTAPQWTDAS